MSKVNWTPEQLAAINIRNADTLVSAAAGSGKTAVLVERVIKLITDNENPIDIDELLVVTFTNAAAAQMKEKISKAIVEGIEKNPGNQRLRNQLMLLGSAEINTIHSFCMNVIRDNIQDTELPLEFGIINDTEKALLKQETMEEVFAELFEDEELCVDFERFVDSFKGKDDKTASESCLLLYEFLRSMPFYMEWLKNDLDRGLVTDVDETIWGRYILEYSAKLVDSASELNEYLCNFIKEHGEEYGVMCYSKSILEDNSNISILKKSISSGMASAYAAFKNLSFPSIGRKTKNTDEEVKEFVQTIRKSYCDILKSIVSGVFVQHPDYMCEILNLSLPYYSMLYEVMKRFDSLFSAKKYKMGTIDFSDLEHKCASVLSVYENGEYIPTTVAKKLRNRFKEVLVDEYQDINLLQESIISMVSAPGRRFMVGDVKQSIYAFRNSKPQLFMDKYDNYSKVDGADTRRLLLSKNFRSASNVLDFANFVFGNIMSKEWGGIDYGDDEKLYFGGGYNHKDTTDLYIFDTAECDDGLGKTEREAMFCASKIKELVDSGYEIEDSGVMRKCCYADFFVLMRNIKKNTDIYRNAFNMYGIPLYVEKGNSYFDSSEIKLIVSVLKIIDNPRQDTDLIAVLRSHIFGFNDDMLVDIRFMDKRLDFYSCLKKSAEAKNEQAERFFDVLNRWRFIAANYSVSVLCETIIDECNFCTVFPEGNDKLRALCDWAERYGKSSYKGLFRFITFLQNQIEANEDIGGNVIPSRDCVTLMTIHKSKGLENGIVFVADTAKDFYMSEIGKSLMYNYKLGVTASYADTENKIMYNSVSHIASACMYKNECKDEEQRLLYVALTRAKYKLIIVGTLRKFEQNFNTLKNIALCKNKAGYSFASAMSGGNQLDWILSAVSLHPGCRIHDGSNDEKKVDCEINVFVNPGINLPDDADCLQMPIVIPDENYDDVKARLEYEYPYKEASAIPFKLSVSEIKNRFYAEYTDDETVFYPRNIDSRVSLIPEPSFMSENKHLSAATIGTAYHSILQYLDYKGDYVLDVKLDEFVVNGILTQAERDVVDVELIKKFLKSDICKQAAAADEIYKEYSFVMPYDSSKLYGGLSETVLVQGIIDLVYRKDGKFYVVDFKSDSYSSSLEIADRYRAQLAMYSDAVEKKFGKRPDKCQLYMLRTGEIIEV